MSKLSKLLLVEVEEAGPQRESAVPVADIEVWGVAASIRIMAWRWPTAFDQEERPS